jgi:hypothetical protein
MTTFWGLFRLLVRGARGSVQLFTSHDPMFRAKGPLHSPLGWRLAT